MVILHSSYLEMDKLIIIHSLAKKSNSSSKIRKAQYRWALTAVRTVIEVLIITTSNNRSIYHSKTRIRIRRMVKTWILRISKVTNIRINNRVKKKDRHKMLLNKINNSHIKTKFSLHPKVDNILTKQLQISKMVSISSRTWVNHKITLTTRMARSTT